MDGVKLLDVDPGKATNRTVVTFVGEPEPVIEAAVRAVRKAAELIDMSKHTGEHPRFGATDVCPLVPIAGVTMEETVEYAHQLAERLGEEVGLTVFCYENAAREERAPQPRRGARRRVRGPRSETRSGDPSWKPDFGPASSTRARAPRPSARATSSIAYNVNLNTTSTRRANAIAFDVREKGRVKRKGNPLTGEIVHSTRTARRSGSRVRSSASRASAGSSRSTGSHRSR